MFALVESHAIRGGLLVSACWLIWRSLGLLSARGRKILLPFTFKTINAYAVVVMILLTLDHLFH